MSDLIEQIHTDVKVISAGRLLFRPIWTRPEMAEGEWMLETQEAGD